MSGSGEDQRFSWGDLWCFDEDAGDAENPLKTEAEARYSAQRLLGAGSFGEVSLVRDARLGRQVAYKVLSRQGDAMMSGRFGREVWVTAQLEHPGIVPLYDAGVREDGSLYYTMRYIRGRSLREALSNCGGLDARLRLLGHFADACHAAAYAHSRAVVHRDLKPDNIMVGEFGETQVVDWGMAAVRGEVPEGGPVREVETWDTHLTVAGAVIGTPAYMSPEQARGEAADERSDVWGLGAILYELLTGQRPYEEGGIEGLLGRLRSGDPAPPAEPLEPAAPPELVAVATRALAHDPGERYPSARELAVEVDNYLHGRRVGAYDYSPGELLLRLIRRWRAPLAVAAVAAVALAAVGAGAWRNVQQERTRAVAAEAETRRHLAEALLERASDAAAAEARPEAELLAARALALAEDPEARGVLARFGAAGRPVPGPSWGAPEACYRVSLAADLETLACLEPGVVSLRSTADGAVIWRQEVDNAGAIGFSERGLDVRAVGAFYRLDLADGHPLAKLSTPEPSAGLSTAGEHYWEIFREELRLMSPDKDPASLRVFKPCRPPSHVSLARFAPGDARLAMACGDGTIWVSEPPTDPPRPMQVTHHTSYLGYSPDGSRLLVAGFRGTFLVLDVASGALLQTLTGPTTAPAISTWSPDGARVAVLDDVGGVWIWDVDTGRVLSRLEAGVSGPAALRFSPDGGALWVLGSEGRVWELPADWPSAELARTGGVAYAALSPDGRWVATAHGDGELAIWDTTTGALAALKQWQIEVTKYAAFSPDGRWLASSGIGENAVKVFEVGSWELVATLESDEPGVSYRRVGFSPDSAVLFGGVYGRGIQSWSVGDWAPGERSPKNNLDLLDTYTTPDRRAIYLTMNTGALLSLEPGGPLMGEPLFAPLAGSRPAVSSDGALLVTLADDGVRVQGLPGGEERLRWETDGHRPLDLAISPDDRWVATAGLDRTVRIWSLADGSLRAVLRGHRERVISLEYSTDGQRLLSGSWDGAARLWDLSGLERPAAELLAELSAAWAAPEAGDAP